MQVIATIQWSVAEGDSVKSGRYCSKIKGSSSKILKIERFY